MESGIPENRSDFSDEGTAAHFLGEQCLTSGEHPAVYIGKTIRIVPGGDAEWDNEPGKWCNTFKVDADMAGAVNTYVQAVRDYAQGGELLVEQELSIEHITGEEDASGTADAVVLRGDEITIIDLKYGRGVEVSADDNPQLKLYALGAIERYALLGDFNTVRLIIIQPRISHAPSEWIMPVSDLLAWGKQVREQAKAVWIALEFRDNWMRDAANAGYLTPGEKQCKFCRAKAVCPALAQHVLSTVADDFVDVGQPIAPQIEHRLGATMDNAVLGNMLGAVDLIESWCKAIRAKAESELLQGHTVPGYKLVQGKRGNRAWTNEAEAEDMMKAMRLKQDEMYTFKLITPTTAEKLLAKESPRRWTKLQALITQSEGNPSVAPESDKRPALVMQPVADEFEALEEADSLV